MPTRHRPGRLVRSAGAGREGAGGGGRRQRAAFRRCSASRLAGRAAPDILRYGGAAADDRSAGAAAGRRRSSASSSTSTSASAATPARPPARNGTAAAIRRRCPTSTPTATTPGGCGSTASTPSRKATGRARAPCISRARACIARSRPASRSVPTGASYKRAEDGIVLVNADICIGCKLCSWACPYGAREFDEDDGVMKKCTLCIDRIYNENLRRRRAAAGLRHGLPDQRPAFRRSR